MDASGGFFICWENLYGDFEIYAQRFDSSGEVLGANFRVNDVGRGWQEHPEMAMDTVGNFVICWEDNRNNGDWDIYAQRYYSDGTPLGRNYMVNQRSDAVNPDQWYPSVALNNDRISFAWEDARRSKGWDIYAKVVTWDWDKVDEPGDDDLGVPKDFTLFQNYPNPFNSTTTIRYHLPAVSSQRSAVSLKIYNILGQEVKTLVNEEKPAGKYRVLWNGRDNSGKEVSSGFYFCRLEVTGDRFKVEKTRKMVLVR